MGTITFENGGIDVGTIIENGEIYYTRQRNKTAVALSKTSGLLNCDANGSLQVCPVNGVGPFYMPAEKTLAGDPSQPVYERDGIWICMKNSTTLKPNDIVKRSTTVAGQIEKFVKATDDVKEAVGIYLGLATQEAELASGDVLQADAASTGLLCVIKFGPVF